MLRALVIFLIGLYQRYLSPYKGYRCAHAAFHHGLSCSAAVKEIVREHGVLGGLPLVRLRFAQCHAAYLQLSAERNETEEERKRRRRRNATRTCGGDDFCDGWLCDAADLNACDLGGCDIDCADCPIGDCNCH
ncbi:MAG: membrane protein insertion efficiency factor YidD [Nevskia sp.]|nr:membrane protein insertion efficiency factor YidD [Nevskia sp.]